MMTPFQFGALYAQHSKTAFSLANIAQTARVPVNYEAARKALISAAVGAGIGGARGFLWPGYDEKFDETGRVVSKKKINPLVGALQGAGIGATTGALSNYAAQTAAQYNPEIDKMLLNLGHVLRK